jgi:hypothetical protein
MKTCVSGLNTLYRGVVVVKHPFYSIWPKMMFGSVSEHFANLRQVKRCKTCVSCLNTLFQGTEAVKHPFYSIGPKLIFGSVWEHFANLRQVKRCKTCVPSLNALFRGTKVVKHLHWIENDVWECFGAFRKPSTGIHMQNLCFGSEYTVSGYQSCEVSILLHWTQIVVWECFRAFC